MRSNQLPAACAVVPLDVKWLSLINPVWLEELDATPFLVACRNGSVTRNQLLEFVRQQFYYSRHFTRYLCALLAQMTLDRDRAELVSNLFEEMGLGEGGGTPHAELYRRMMGSLGVRLGDSPQNGATSYLVKTMLELCGHPDPLCGLAALCLGAEAIVPHVYSQIMLGFAAVGEPVENLEFFRIHIEGDDAHAETMCRILERELCRVPFQRTHVHHVAQRVIAARTLFFRALAEPAAEDIDVAV
jgi:pyrroloquinoline quinone (PQQ) biosynthesis protein C